MAIGQSKLLFTGRTTSGDSPETVEVLDANAVILEAWPNGSGQATIQLLDSGDPTTGYFPAVDAAGLLSAITGRTKVQVNSVLPYVRARLTVVSGAWNVRATPIQASGVTVVSAVVSGTLAQGAPNAGGGNAWPMAEAVYSAPSSGEILGSVAAAVLPTLPCRLVRFKARATNVGRIYLGAAGVTLPDGVADATTGLELSAGDDSGWIPIDNLNRLYRISDNAADNMTYLVMV